MVLALAGQGASQLAHAYQLLLLRSSPHLPVLHDPKQKLVPDLSGSQHGFVNSAAAVAHIHPTTSFGGPARSCNALQPQLRFSWPPLALLRVFASRRRLANPQLLVSQAEDLTRQGQDGQAVVLQKALAAAIADGSHTLQRRVLGEIQVGRIVDDQDHGVLSHRLPRELPMRSLEGWQGGRFLIAQVVEGPQGIPIENLGKGFLRPCGDRRGRLNQAPRSPPVSKIDRTKVALGPVLGSRVVHDNLDDP